MLLLYILKWWEGKGAGLIFGHAHYEYLQCRRGKARELRLLPVNTHNLPFVHNDAMLCARPPRSAVFLSVINLFKFRKWF